MRHSFADLLLSVPGQVAKNFFKEHINRAWLAARQISTLQASDVRSYSPYFSTCFHLQKLQLRRHCYSVLAANSCFLAS